MSVKTVSETLEVSCDLCTESLRTDRDALPRSLRSFRWVTLPDDLPNGSPLTWRRIGRRHLCPACAEEVAIVVRLRAAPQMVIIHNVKPPESP